MKLEQAILKELNKRAKKNFFEKKLNALMSEFYENQKNKKVALWEITLTKGNIADARKKPLTPSMYLYGLISLGAEIGKLNPLFRRNSRGNMNSMSAKSVISYNFSPVNNVINNKNFLKINLGRMQTFYIGLRGEYLNEFLVVHESVALNYGKVKQLVDKAKFFTKKVKKFFGGEETPDQELASVSGNVSATQHYVNIIMRQPVYVVGVDGLYGILNLLINNSNPRSRTNAAA